MECGEAPGAGDGALAAGVKSVPSPHDAADALAVAICHFHHAAFKERIAAV
jgi:Holliday junction resolvasome RuvABC endonuclease subunit